MKFRISSFTYLLFIFLAACNAPPAVTVPPSATQPPPTAVPTETSAPSPTETPLPSPSPTLPPTETEELPANPGPRAIGDMVFHEGLGMVVMLNGSQDTHLWGWDGTQWTILSASGPEGRTSSGMAYDPQRDKLVMYGGRLISNERCMSDTWEWDEQGWQTLDVPSPDVCSHFSMEYDAALGKVVLWGGGNAEENGFSDMWTWDGQQWEKLDAETPPVRFHAMSASDPVHGQLFILGGFDINNQMYDEFWAWDGTTWSPLDIARPPALSHARMVFDTARVQLVLFGGTTRPRFPLDLQEATWILTDGTWRQVNPDGPAPAPRGGHMMAYDPVRERVVLYGGFNADDEGLADTWEWNGLGWICLDGCEPATDTVSPPTFGPDVVLYRGDAHRAGVYDFPALRTLPELVWEKRSSLEYYENLLLHENVLYAGGSDGKLYAFDALTGEELWRGGDFQTAVSAVAISGDVLVMGGYNRLIQALDRRTGESLWKTTTEGRTLAPILILEDRVFASATNAYYALNLETGEVLWEAPLPSENEFDFVSAPAYEAGKLYLSVGKSFIALDAETGETVWEITKDTYFYFSAVGAYAYVGNEDGFFYAYDLETGEEVWKFEGGSEIWFGPAVTEDTVYVGHFNGVMYALDASTGEKRWEFQAENWAVSDAVLSDGVLYFTDCNHVVDRQECHLYALDATTGEELWTYGGTGTFLGTPVLGNDVIYLVLSANLLALR